MVFEVTISAFALGATIPTEYTCDGIDKSPKIMWKNAPQGTKSFALIMDDPDAPMGTFVHWVLYDLPPNVTELPESIPKTETLVNGAKQGANDYGAGVFGYGGPCPPKGKPHRYYFKVYALDAMLNLSPKINKAMLEKAMQGHILAQAEYMGTYKR